jgi:hypothetical protein
MTSRGLDSGSLTIEVKDSTISVTDQLFSEKALSISPGTKKEVMLSPVPTARS